MNGTETIQLINGTIVEPRVPCMQCYCAVFTTFRRCCPVPIPNGLLPQRIKCYNPGIEGNVRSKSLSVVCDLFASLRVNCIQLHPQKQILQSPPLKKGGTSF